MKHKKDDKLNIEDDLGWKYYYGHINKLRECDFYDELEEDFKNPVFDHGYARMIPSKDGEFESYILPVDKKHGHGIFPFTIIQEGKGE